MTVALSEIAPRCAACIEAVDETCLTPNMLRRMRELGLRPGQDLTVVQSTAGGGRVVCMAAMRYALDKDVVNAIKVSA